MRYYYQENKKKYPPRFRIYTTSLNPLTSFIIQNIYPRKMSHDSNLIALSIKYTYIIMYVYTYDYLLFQVIFQGLYVCIYVKAIDRWINLNYL